MNNGTGILYIVPTPIGNLEDITLRGLKILLNAQYIVCEDTRVTGQLLKLLREKWKSFIQTSISPQLISYREQTEKSRIPGILTLLKNGFDVVLTSDAGTPLISDPGFRLVRECLQENIQVNSLPGANAVTVALASSGLPTDKFMFLGYPPHKSGHRKTLYLKIRQSAEILSSTFILFEAPHKLRQTLEEIKENIGDIDITICRELTKIHEETWHGIIEDAQKKFNQPKGEFVLLFHL